MHYIVRATLPVDAGNDMIHGDMGGLMDKIMADVRPETAYFAVENGQRTIYFIVNIEKASEITRICEPLWLALSADVDVIPTMTQDDFGEAMGSIADIAARYA